MANIPASGSTAQPAAKGAAMWEDNSVELNDLRVRKTIPKLPQVANDLQVVISEDFLGLAYMMLQTVRAKDKIVIMRAIASVVGSLLKDGSNFTGSQTVPELLVLPKIDENTDPTTIIDSNFKDAEPVTVADLLEIMEADEDEVGAFFGVLFIAGNKRVTTENRTAFNERRASAATASIIGKPVIFVPNSKYLTDDILGRVHAAFLSCAPLRANMTAKVLPHLEKAHMGPPLAFMSMFLLLVDVGMSAIRIIKEATMKHPWILTDFPELHVELRAANEAQNIIKMAPGRERSFLKAIHGSNFVPVNYAQIDNLLGVCKETLKRTTPSYQNYGGGRVTAAQLEKINLHVDATSALVNPVPVE